MNHEFRFTVQKIAQRISLLEKLAYRQKHEISPFFFQELSSPLDISLQSSDIHDDDWVEIAPDSYWATSKTNFMMRTAFVVPEAWGAKHPAAVYLPLGEAGSFSHPEALIFIDGDAYAGTDRHHQEVMLRPEHCDGQPHTLTLHGWTGNTNSQGENARLLMRPCYVVQVDVETRELVALARTTLDVAQNLHENDPVRGNLLNLLDDAFKLIDLREPHSDAFYESVPRAMEHLTKGLDSAGSPLDVEIIASGHAHIDVAWLWTLGQTRRKAGRTFNTVLRLMEQFPEYHFTQSQPQLYSYVQQDYPQLFEAIKGRIADGRWEVIGGMWVEADCNISGGESLARQFLLGRTYFREHFGAEAESPVLWLPDVFGYAWNLPQLIKEAGLKYFFTIKIGWNQYNKIPYDSFWWQGLDGTKVLTHFSPTPEQHDAHARATYNANPTAQNVLYTWYNYKQKEDAKTILMAYGFGDGGGGPTREMLESIRTMNKFPATPRIRNGSVIDFFEKLEAEAGDKLPTWNGELYLEYHRGTYTTHSGNKRANRKSEFLLHDAELAASIARQLDKGYAYPVHIFNEAWELVCLNQFHDILPGSSIGDVYTESMEQYAEIKDVVEFERNRALEVIGAHAGSDLIAFNPTSFYREEVVLWENAALKPDESIEYLKGGSVMTQNTDGGVYLAVNAPPNSITPLIRKKAMATRVTTRLAATTKALKNNYVELYFNDAGDITRIYDIVNEREVLPPKAIANQFLAFEDRPMTYDAWDIDIFYTDKMWQAEPASKISVVEMGPLRATVEITRQILKSEFTQRISLYFNSPRIDFDTIIDWQERHILLKTAFPIDVLSPTATYEIQWGNVERPTHKNTSWDWARFETAAQKWVDLSEGDYGVSLLNDSKYGHDIHDNVMRLTLLRSSTHPDPHADEGMHRFAYSLLPHAGRWDEATIREAYALNDPLIVAQANPESELSPKLNGSFIRVDKPNIVIETVKRAEDGEGIIVRLYETMRRRGKITLTTNFKVGHAWRTNIMEENGSSLTVTDAETGDGSSIAYRIRPYEIVTLRIMPV